MEDVISCCLSCRNEGGEGFAEAVITHVWKMKDEGGRCC